MDAVPRKFDPFKSRLARNIRNNLSNSFMKALEGRNAELYRRKAAVFLAQTLEQPYQGYIEERLAKYNEVFAIVTSKGSDDTMRQAEVLWSHGLYFEMHELLEKLWIDAEGAERRALQGLIRAAGMMIHAEAGNMRAAASMGRKARAALELYGSALTHFAGLEAISAEIAQTLADLDNALIDS